MRVAAFTSGRSIPSARFRVRQHVAPLATLGVEVVEHQPLVPQAVPVPRRLAGVRRRYFAPFTAGWLTAHASARLPSILGSRGADAVWIERALAPGFDWLVRALKPPVVLDLDDAVWLEGLAGRATPSLARASHAVIAGNRYLADWCRTYCRAVHVVPTAVDCRRIRPRAGGERPGFVVGWTGTWGNYPYLAAIEPALAVILREIPGAALLVIADRPPSLPRLAGLDVRYVPWSETAEVEALAAMDVGLMPLADTEWTRGKCSFKMLQYMAAGVASVVSPVGNNTDVLALGDVGLAADGHDAWVEALRGLARDPDRRTRLGAVGRAVAETHFDLPVIARQIARIFLDLAPRT